MKKTKRISIRKDPKSYNRWFVTIGGRPVYSTGGKLTAERQANILRRKKGKRVR